MRTEVEFYDLPVVEVELPGYHPNGIPGPKGDKGDKGDTGDTGATFTPNVDEEGILSWENDRDLENPESVDLKLLLEKVAVTELEGILEEIADLKYKEIQILSIGANVSTAELGSTVNEIEMEWETNKTPVSMTFDGADRTITEGATTFGWFSTVAGITTDKTWTVNVVDERGAEDSATASLKFLNGVYYGALAYGGTIDSAAILGLTRKLQSSRAVDFTVTPGEGKRPVYACPARYGTPTFRIGGFAYAWEKVSTFRFTNASGYTESYDVWMHGQDVSGSITVNVT